MSEVPVHISTTADTAAADRAARSLDRVAESTASTDAASKTASKGFGALGNAWQGLNRKLAAGIIGLVIVALNKLAEITQKVASRMREAADSSAALIRSTELSAANLEKQTAGIKQTSDQAVASIREQIRAINDLKYAQNLGNDRASQSLAFDLAVASENRDAALFDIDQQTASGQLSQPDAIRARAQAEAAFLREQQTARQRAKALVTDATSRAQTGLQTQASQTQADLDAERNRRDAEQRALQNLQTGRLATARREVQADPENQAAIAELKDAEKTEQLFLQRLNESQGRISAYRQQLTAIQRELFELDRALRDYNQNLRTENVGLDDRINRILQTGDTAAAAAAIPKPEKPTAGPRRPTATQIDTAATAAGRSVAGLETIATNPAFQASLGNAAAALTNNPDQQAIAQAIELLNRLSAASQRNASVSAVERQKIAEARTRIAQLERITAEAANQ
jgi:hypothetical protein